MKSCSYIKELMSMYIDGMLKQSELEEFGEHISGCMSCKNELSELKLMVECCKDISNEDVPIGFKETLHERLVNESLIYSGGDKKIRKIKNKHLVLLTSIAATVIALILIRGFADNPFINSKSPSMQFASRADGGFDSGSKAKEENINTSKDSATRAGESKNQNTPADYGQITNHYADNGLDSAYQKKNFSENVTASDEKSKLQVGSGTFNKKSESNDLKAGSNLRKDESQSSGQTALKQAFNNAVINKSTDVTVFLKDIKSGTELISKIVADNGGSIDYKPSSSINSLADDKGAVEFTTSGQVNPKTSYEGTQDEVLIKAKIPSSRILSFEEAVGKNGVDAKFNSIVNTDVTQNIKELNKRLDDINIKIDSANKNNSISSISKDTSNKPELESLENEKQGIESEINNLNNDSNYVTVFITIKKQK